MKETRVQSLGQEDPLEKTKLTSLVFLPEEFHGQRNLASYSPWGHKELDTTEQLTCSLFHVVLLAALYRCECFIIKKAEH